MAIVKNVSRLKKCIVCGEEMVGRKDKKYCSHNCWNKEWGKKNRKKCTEMSRKWRKENRKRSRELNNNWRESNEDKFKEINLNYYYANIEKFKQNYQDNAEIRKKQAKIWRRNNKDKVRKYRIKRRCYTTDDFDIDFIKSRDNDKCQICGSTKDIQLEHYIPISKGGINSNINCYLICKKCHIPKGKLDPEDYFDQNAISKLNNKGIVGEVRLKYGNY